MTKKEQVGSSKNKEWRAWKALLEAEQSNR